MGKNVLTYDDPNTVNPMWVIDLAERNDRTVESILEEHNINIPTED